MVGSKRRYIARLDRTDLMRIAKEAREVGVIAIGDLSCYSRDEFLEILGPVES